MSVMIPNIIVVINPPPGPGVIPLPEQFPTIGVVALVMAV